MRETKKKQQEQQQEQQQDRSLSSSCGPVGFCGMMKSVPIG